MINYALKLILGTKNEREIKKIRPLVARINELEPRTQKLSQQEMQERIRALREEVAKGRKLDEILPEVFAMVREASVRAVGMRHFDVQLIGGKVLHDGKIAEMKTGEGKTLVATLPCVLNALDGKGVHVVTVNDYLARRDAEWMGRIYKYLGLTVGVVVHEDNPQVHKQSYQCDITYGQNNEFGFDYLRDNMKFDLNSYVQRELHYAIVDEVDSILIDEARTPLIISGPSEESTELYYRINQIIPSLIKEQDFTVDEKSRTVALTDEGVEKLEKKFGVPNLYDPEQMETLHHIEQALRAHQLYRKDHDYVVKDGEVIIVDEFTGRLMPGRRWSDGLHQAVEAKEGVKIENENQTVATISFQNYFRMYSKLAGMTGTADTEAEEFAKIYNLDVLVAPTHRKMVREDRQDTVYKTEREKFKAVCDEIEDCHKRGQPVLVGTVSIAKSEVVSNVLKKRGIPHHVLNAKQHEKEAEIIAQAGRKGALTISTNMAGRGTDILLGGNPEFMARRDAGAEPEREAWFAEARLKASLDAKEGAAPAVPPTEADWQKAYAAWDAAFKAALEKHRAECEAEHAQVVEVGGLHVLGTERHESRRIDNQLRGRSGRQGDPGSSKFFLSLEDDLMRIFASERISKLMETFGVQENEPIEHPWLTKAIESAQKRVEGQHFDSRKHLLEYDDVMNQQRKTIYSLRKAVLAAGSGLPLVEFTEDAKTRKKTRSERVVEWDEQKERLLDLIEDMIIEQVETCLPHKKSDEWDPERLRIMVKEQFDTDMSFEGAGGEREKLEMDIFNVVEKKYLKRWDGFVPFRRSDGSSRAVPFRDFQKWVYLETIDTLWKDHLLAMDHLRQGIGLRGYGQKDPKQEYKKEGYELFSLMMGRIGASVVSSLLKVEVADAPATAAAPAPSQEVLTHKAQKVHEHRGGDGDGKPKTVERAAPRIGRNDPCYCGSGKKYKKCHLPLDEAAGTSP